MTTFMNLLLEALHMFSFDNFVNATSSYLSKLTIAPSYCFPNTIPDNLTAYIVYLD